MITTLEKLGLSEKEAKVYLATLELGSDSVQNIAKKAQVNRATTYVILETLAKKGLSSSYEKGTKTFFTAESPEQLDRLIKKKEEGLVVERSELEKLIPELKAIYNLAGSKPKVKYYEGKEGHETMLHDTLINAKAGDEIYAFTPLDIHYESRPEDRQIQVKNRIEKKIKIKTIYTHKEGPVENAVNKEEFREARFIPSDKFPFQSVISIGPSKIVRIYSYKEAFSGVTIEDERVFNTMKAIFNLAWESTEKYN